MKRREPREVAEQALKSAAGVAMQNAADGSYVHQYGIECARAGGIGELEHVLAGCRYNVVTPAFRAAVETRLEKLKKGG